MPDATKKPGKPAAELLAGGETARGTREKLIITSLELFYRHGFHAIGLDRILSEVGVTKTTFYNHFESKDDLIEEALDKRAQWEFDGWKANVIKKAGDDPKARLIAIFDVMHEWFTHPDYNGCIFITAAAEFPSSTDPIHRKAVKHNELFEGWIIEQAARAGLKEPQTLGKKLNLLMSGATTMRITAGDDSAAFIARQIAEALIERHSD